MDWKELNTFLVKEHAGIFKAANNYDVFDIATGEKVLECREPNLGIFTKLFRFTDYKRMTPFHIEIRDTAGNVVVEVKRGISVFLSKVEVYDGEGVYIGGFKQKLFSIGGKFNVLDDQQNEICKLKGKWTSWDFKFVDKDTEYAHVSKEWAGLGKELFTTADNYMLEIYDNAPQDSNMRKLILAAVMCIDMVLKE